MDAGDTHVLVSFVVHPFRAVLAFRAGCLGSLPDRLVIAAPLPHRRNRGPRGFGTGVGCGDVACATVERTVSDGLGVALNFHRFDLRADDQFWLSGLLHIFGG